MFTFAVVLVSGVRAYIYRDGKYIALYDGLIDVPDNVPHDAETVDLTGNKISQIKAYAFSNLTVCTELVLGSNNISYISPQAFVGLVKLQSLSLDGNELVTISDGTFSPLRSLTYVNLSNNNIKTLSSSVFKSQPRPLLLNLRKNPLRCDSRLCWLRKEEKAETIRWKNDREPSCKYGWAWWHTWSCPEPGRKECKGSHLQRVGL